MEKFKGVLLVSDFDATLTDDTGEIPKTNIDAIKYFIAEGGKFTLSTGRTKEGFQKFDASFINTPILVANGAMAYDYSLQRVVFENSIGENAISAINAVAEKYKGMCIEFFSSRKGAFVLNPDEETYSHFKGLNFEFKEINGITSDIFPLVKIMLGVREKTFEVQEYLKNVDLGDMAYIPCTGSYVEILSNKAGKGKGLLKLADILNISRDNTYAIGDGSNDVDMLKVAAIGFAPRGGDPIAVRSADRLVCDNNKGAVAGAIEALCGIYR